MIESIQELIRRIGGRRVMGVLPPTDVTTLEPISESIPSTERSLIDAKALYDFMDSIPDPLQVSSGFRRDGKLDEELEIAIQNWFNAFQDQGGRFLANYTIGAARGNNAICSECGFRANDGVFSVTKVADPSHFEYSIHPVTGSKSVQVTEEGRNSKKTLWLGYINFHILSHGILPGDQDNLEELVDFFGEDLPLLSSLDNN